MKTFIIAFVVVVLAALGAMFALSHTRSNSPGEIVTEVRAATGFHRIDVQGNVDVNLVQGANEGVTVEAPAGFLRRIRTEVRNGTLVIDAAQETRGWGWLTGSGTTKPARLTVNLRELDEVEAAGVVSIAAATLKANELHLDVAGASKLRIGDLQATRLRLDGAGATKADIRGKVARQDVDLSGAGSYDAGQLVSDDARVDVSGAGKALVNVRKTLKVDIAGAGKVEYIGDPELSQSISGVGKVTKRSPQP
jgi:hypothetical protein